MPLLNRHYLPPRPFGTQEHHRLIGAQRPYQAQAPSGT